MTILPDIWMTVRGHRRPGRPVTADVEVGALLGKTVNLIASSPSCVCTFLLGSCVLKQEARLLLQFSLLGYSSRIVFIGFLPATLLQQHLRKKGSKSRDFVIHFLQHA